MKSNVICNLPWIHACVRSDNTLKPCCRYNPDHITSKINLDDISKNGISAMNSDHMKTLRTNMLNNIWDPGCKKCQNNEEGNVLSMRQHMNRDLPITTPLTVDFQEIRFIEMTLDNICNLQCVMCDSSYSSKLQKRDMFFKGSAHKKLEPTFRKFDNVNFDKLEQVKILGGEPFISPNFELFLDYLIERCTPKNIIIKIATNATTIPNASLIDKLNLFKHVKLTVSLDSYHPSNDFQRFGSSFTTTYKNSFIYHSLFKNVSVGYHATVSILTANTFETLLIQLENRNVEKSIDFVRYPPYLSVTYAPDDYWEWLFDNVKYADALTALNSIKKDHKYNEEHWKMFKTHLAKLENYYKINLKDYNLPLYKYLKGNP